MMRESFTRNYRPGDCERRLEAGLDGEALRVLLGAKPRERQSLLDAFDILVREPHQPVDFVERSPNQRDYSVKVIGRFAVTFWLEPEKIVRVMRIIRVTGK